MFSVTPVQNNPNQYTRIFVGQQTSQHIQGQAVHSAERKKDMHVRFNRPQHGRHEAPVSLGWLQLEYKWKENWKENGNNEDLYRECDYNILYEHTNLLNHRCFLSLQNVGIHNNTSSKRQHKENRRRVGGGVHPGWVIRRNHSMDFWCLSWLCLLLSNWSWFPT